MPQLTQQLQAWRSPLPHQVDGDDGMMVKIVMMVMKAVEDRMAFLLSMGWPTATQLTCQHQGRCAEACFTRGTF